MTSSETYTELDERTKEELQPPCEWIVLGQKCCTKPAQWALRTRCPVCDKSRLWLYCDPHAAYFIAGKPVICIVCRDKHPAEVLAGQRL